MKDTIARYTVRGEMKGSLTTMFTGGIVFLIGALVLNSRVVAVSGWLVAVLGVVNYLRWLISRRDTPIRSRQPWE